METIEKLQNLFSKETGNIQLSDISVREVKVLDQYAGVLKKSMNKYNTPRSICGYMVSVIGPIVAESLFFDSKASEIEALVKTLNDPNTLISKLENCMEVIQSQRAQYLKDYTYEFKTEKEKKNYITDWIAKYEISDLMQIFSPEIENLFFLRYVSFEFPHLIPDVKHEEKKRLVEEERFRGNKFIIESFYEGRKLETIDQWIYGGTGTRLSTLNKPLVFIADLLGHFVTFVACKVKLGNGRTENTVIMLNSVKENYMEREEVIYTICQLAFPESILMTKCEERENGQIFLFLMMLIDDTKDKNNVYSKDFDPNCD